MYVWSFAIYDKVIIGRTWEEFYNMISDIVDFLNLDENKRFIIYVHNLAYEFQFIRKMFEWKTVFSLDKRKPIKALTNTGIEFRCSYLLSGYGLAKLSEQLLWHNVKKLVGYLNYDLVRTPITPLTEQELEYSMNDVLVVTAYIEEQVKECGDITKIPLTKTGYVRNFMRNKCLYADGKHINNNQFKIYRSLMSKLTLTPMVYRRLKEGFAGGFTHANPVYSGEIMEFVKSFDFTSSYPAVMVSEKFPMSEFREVYPNDENDLIKYMLNKACLVSVHIYGLKATTIYENYISKSHCAICKNAVENNGRIVSADEILTTVTEQDLSIIFQMYEWEDMQIEEMYIADKAYLPKPIIEGVLELYGKKTTLKEVEGKEAEYMRSKENINSTFGMCVTDICRDEIIYDENEWDKDKPDLERALVKYNRSKKRFLYYAWGVWITAYARKNLFSGILEFGEDYCYSDTDSIKVLNYSKHMDYINTYNKMIVSKIDKCLKYYNLDTELARPKNKKGVTKQLGVWNEEELYTRFKTLGAKRYMVEYEKDGKKVISMTVSGVNKKKAIPYLLDKYGAEGIFDAFNNELEIPAEYYKDGVKETATGKMTHTYIDTDIYDEVTDYLGNTCKIHELSGVHMEGADYKLSLSEDYVNYLLGIKDTVYATD